MSARKGILVSRRAPCDGGQSPNRFIPAITVEIRVFFPPNTVTQAQVLDVVEEAGHELGYRLAEALPMDGTWKEQGVEGPNLWLTRPSPDAPT